MNKKKEYAVYKGDEFIDLGTIEELSERLKIRKDTLYWYSCCKRWKKQSKKANRFIVICLD